MNAARPSAAAAIEARRKAGVKAIKATQRALGLDDGTYREILRAQTRGPLAPQGKSSATDLTVQEQGIVLDYLRRTYRGHPGATNPAEQRRREQRAGGRKRSAPAEPKVAMMGKLAELLAELGRVTGEPYTLAYADAICRRNGWCDRIDFASPQILHQVIGAVSRTVRAKAAAAGKATVA